MWMFAAMLGRTWAAPALPDTPPGGVQLTLVLGDAALEEGEVLPFSMRIDNGSAARITIARPVDGSFDQIRDPRWSLEFLDEDGNVVPSALGYGFGRDCGLFNDLESADLRAIVPGGQVTLKGDDLLWVPPQKVLPSAHPGRYRVRAHYRSEGAGGLTPIDLRSAPVDLVITGGSARLWQCRTEQIAARDRYESTEGSIVAVFPRKDGYRLLLSSLTLRAASGERSAEGRVWVQDTDHQLSPSAKPVELLRIDEPGYVAAVEVPNGLLLAHTPGAVGGRRVETLWWQEGGTPKATVISKPPGNPYVIGLAREGDQVLLAFNGPDSLEDALLVQALDPTGRPLGQPHNIGASIDRPLLISGPKGIVLGYSPEAQRFRTQPLSSSGAPSAGSTDWHIDGAAMRLLAHAASLELIVADAGYRGDDPNDRMGLYHQRGPNEVPIPLTPRDRQTARFGTGAFIGDTLAWAWAEEGTLYAHIGAATALVSRTLEGEPNVAAVGPYFALSFRDHRDDRSVACTELGECVGEAYLGLYDAAGNIVVPPTRVTHVASPRPAAPYDDWERLCP